MVSVRTTRQRSVGALTMRLLVALWLATVATSAACSSPSEGGQAVGAPPPKDRPAPEATGGLWTRPSEGTCDCHGHDYETLNELVTESDLIVLGTVGESRVADVIDGSSEFPTRPIHTTVAVNEVLKGSTDSEQIVVSTDELGFGGPGVEEWREPGRRVLLFLTSSLETEDVYVPSNLAYFQTAYVATGENLEITVAPGADVYRLNHRVAAMTLSEARERIETLAG